MIVTLTPNPSIDRTVELDQLVRGQVLRAKRAAQVDPGGKGINVVRVLAAAGVDATAVLPVGGAEGAQLLALLHERGLQPEAVGIAGSIRVNTALVEPGGLVTKVNEAGPRLSPAEADALLAAVSEQAIGASWVVGCGSLARGLDIGFWADVVERGHRAGARVAIDPPARRCAPRWPRRRTS